MSLSPETIEALARAIHVDWLRELREVHGVDRRHAPWDHEESLAVEWDQLSPRAQEYNRQAACRQVAIFAEHLSGHLVPLEGGD